MKTKISLLSMLLLFTISSARSIIEIIDPIIIPPVTPPIIVTPRSLVLETQNPVNLALLWEGSGTITVNGATMLNNRFLNNNIPPQNGKVTLSIPENVELINFEVYSSEITNCTINNHKKLQLVLFRIHVVGATRSLKSLIITSCPELLSVGCENNKMTTLSIINCPKLVELSCSDNQLTTLDSKNFKQLQYFFCSNNKLTTLDLSNCKELKQFGCNNNLLTSLNVNGFSELTYFACQNNSLSTLNVNGCSKLKYLSCQNNSLKALNVSGFDKLDSLQCNNNQISNLNITGCANLKKIYANEQSISVNASNGKNPISYINKTGLQTATTISGAQYAPNDNLPTNLGSILSFTHPLPSGVTGNAFSGSITILNYVQPPVTIAVTGVTVTPTTLSLTVGETGTIAPKIAPDNATIKDVSWSTSNGAVATVSPLGIVTAISPGTATIKVTTNNNSKTASCMVTVTAPVIVPVSSITVSPPTLQLAVGSSVGALTAIFIPSNATNQDIEWSSSNEAVAIVSTSGVVAPVSVGSAIITAKTSDGNKTAFCMVTVESSVSNENVGGDISITAYPNPTSGAVTITGLTPGKAIRIYSITGSLVGTYTAQEEKMTINLDNLNRGMYFLNFEGKVIKVIKY